MHNCLPLFATAKGGIANVTAGDDLADGIPFLILDNGAAAIIERGPYLLQELNDIVQTTEFLFDLAEE